MTFGQVFAFDIETVPDVATGRVLLGLIVLVATFNVASTLARFEVMGSWTDRGTDGSAAWCST